MMNDVSQIALTSMIINVSSSGGIGGGSESSWSNWSQSVSADGQHTRNYHHHDYHDRSASSLSPFASSTSNVTTGVSETTSTSNVIQIVASEFLSALINGSNSGINESTSVTGDIGEHDYYDKPYYGAYLEEFRSRYYIPIHGWLSITVCLFGIIANVLNIIVLTRFVSFHPPSNSIYHFEHLYTCALS